MNIPKELTLAVRNKEKRIRQELQEERRKEQRERRQELKRKLSEKEAFPQKVELCRKILSWANEFRQTKEGQKLIKKKDVYCRSVKAVTVGGWSCDPRTGKKAHRPILSFDITSEGVAHKERWNWIGYTYTEFTEPEKMAQKLYYAYLQLVWKQLESGKVFKDVVRWTKGDID